jgi:uncharacterized membrane protein
MMKSFIKSIVVGLFVLLYSSILPANEGALYAVTGVDNDDYLNVRQKATARSAIVTRLPYDSVGVRRLEGEAMISGNRWWRVRWEGKQGWVNQRYLRPVVKQAHSPIVSTSSRTKSAKTPATLHCGGNEPFWGMKITKNHLNYSPMDGKKLNLPVVFNKTSENNTSIAAIYAKQGNQQILAMLQKVSACSDGMSDIDYPYAIAAIINQQQFYSGCCHVK